MANFEIAEKPEYKPSIRKFETTDPAHADLFNEVIESLINNDTFLKLFTETLAEKISEHVDNSKSHITQEDRNKWDEVYVHPNTHPPAIIVQDASNRFMTDAERNKLLGIAASANNYTHPTGNGSNHIPAGGGAGQVLQYSSAGAAVWSSTLNNYLPLAGGNVTGTILSTATNALQLSTMDSRIVDVYGYITLRTYISDGQPNIEIGQRNSNIGNVRIYSSRDPNKGFSVWDVSEDRGIFYAQENASYQPIIKAPPAYETTTSNSPNMYVSPQGIFYRSTSSSKRYKHNIRVVDTEQHIQTRSFNHFIKDSNYLKKVLDIEIFLYDYNDSYITKYYNNYNPAKNKIGFLAEQVNEVFPEAVEYSESYDEETDIASIDYEKPETWDIKTIVPAMLYCIKEHEQKIKEQEFIIAEMSTKIDNLVDIIEELQEKRKKIDSY